MIRGSCCEKSFVSLATRRIRQDDSRKIFNFLFVCYTLGSAVAYCRDKIKLEDF